jgi:hypothetical protein
MNTLVTKERRIREAKQTRTRERCYRTLKAVAAEPNAITPADNADGHMLRVFIVDDHRASAYANAARFWNRSTSSDQARV